MLKSTWRPVCNRRARKLRKRGEDVRWFSDDYYSGYKWKPSVLYPWQRAFMDAVLNSPDSFVRVLVDMQYKRQPPHRMYVGQNVYDRLVSGGFDHEDLRVVAGVDLASGPDKTVYHSLETAHFLATDEMKRDVFDGLYSGNFEPEVNDHGQPSSVLPEKKV